MSWTCPPPPGSSGPTHLAVRPDDPSAPLLPTWALVAPLESDVAVEPDVAVPLVESALCADEEAPDDGSTPLLVLPEVTAPLLATSADEPVVLAGGSDDEPVFTLLDRVVPEDPPPWLLA